MLQKEATYKLRRTVCIYAATVGRVSLCGKKEDYLNCIWILRSRENGARSSLMNCMMIPTALDFPLAIKESL
jgi:hypothetical protein